MRILQRKSVERGAVGKREETKKVNSSAFNDIIRAYCKLALNDAGVDEKMADAVMSQFRHLFDTISAKKALDNMK
jgi:hypothetical protein